MERLTIESRHRQELIDVTGRVEEIVRGRNWGAVLVYVPHTTAGVLINEHADPDVARDLQTALDRLLPSSVVYRHAEGNSEAHIKATLVGTSQIVPVEAGRLALGTWQGIFFAEFDGPRRRTLVVVPLPSVE